MSRSKTATETPRFYPFESSKIRMRIALSRSVASAVAFGSLFVVLAMMSPTTTFHLGPVVVSASGAVAAGPGHGPWPALSSFGIALLAVGFLHRLDFLMGPSLLPVGGAVLESLLGATAGALLSPVILHVLQLMQRPEADQA